MCNIFLTFTLGPFTLQTAQVPAGVQWVSVALLAHAKGSAQLAT